MGGGRGPPATPVDPPLHMERKSLVRKKESSWSYFQLPYNGIETIGALTSYLITDAVEVLAEVSSTLQSFP